MIEVVIFPTNDRAEAESPEGALLAARTMIRDALGRGCNCGMSLSAFTATFLVDGRRVRELTGKEVMSDG